MAVKNKESKMVKSFVTAFTMGLKSQVAIQVALMALFADYGVRRAKVGAGADLEDLQAVVRFMAAPATVNNVQSKAIFSYLENVAGFNIDQKMWTVKPRRSMDYDENWLQVLRQVTWFAHAASLVEWKSPKVSWASGVAGLLKKNALGEAPDWAQVLEDLKSQFEAGKNSKSLRDWIDAGIEKGTLKKNDDGKLVMVA